jgi:glyoxylase-like metal-dependent hydrolase (beta-lactamase superfamily II)
MFTMFAVDYTSGSGFLHTKIGDVDFYCINDGDGSMPNALFPDASRDILQKFAPSGKSPSSFSAFVVKKGTQTILFDTGNGNQLLTNLKTAGIKTDEISAVVLTHSHGDHVGGLFSGDKQNFPNASVWITEKEVPYWKNAGNSALLAKTVDAYGELKIITTDEKTPVVIPEVVAIDVAGHTPGHTAFLVSSGNDKVVIAGDLLHGAAIQFPNPEISCRYDNNPKQAAESRQMLLARAANENWIFTASHIPFPGFGKIEKAEKGFKFVQQTNLK